MTQIINQLFEEECAKFLNVEHCIAVNSGTSALIATLYSLGLSLDDEVITTPFSFISTANAIVIAGATPVFVDIHPRTHLIDPEEIKKAITIKTKAVLVVHLFGRVCQMDEIKNICAENNLILIEDSAQAFGARYKNDFSGSIGDAGCFSFYKTKNMSTFEGGLIALKRGSRLDANKIRAISIPAANKPEYEYIGFNFRMPEPCALIGLQNLKMHKTAIYSELGINDESKGFYPYVIYKTKAYINRGITGDCPIAESVADKIKFQ